MSDDEKNDNVQSYVEANAIIKDNILSGTYTLTHKDGRSKIWRYYDRIINDKGDEIIGRVCCVVCYAVLNYDSRSTTNLLNHKCHNKGKSIKNYKSFTWRYFQENAEIKKKILSGTYTLNHRGGGRSQIWKFYDRIINDKGEEISKRVCCTLCYTVLCHNPNTTSNLLKHKCHSKMRRIKTYRANVVSTCPYKLENAKIKQKIVSGSFKLRKKLSKCKVWDTYSAIEDSEGNEIPKKVCCNKCLTVLNQNPKCSSNLVKHKCYTKSSDRTSLNTPSHEIDPTISSHTTETESSQDEEDNILLTEIKKSPSLMELENLTESNELIESPFINVSTNHDLKTEAIKIFSQWCIENSRPFELAKDIGLRRFTEFIISVIANYGANINIDNILPEALSIAQRIESQYDVSFEELRKEIEIDCTNGYGLTSKLWSDNCWQKEYIALTIHYIKNGQLITKLLGLNLMDKENYMYDDDVLEIKIQEILNNFNVTYKDSITVIDGSLNTSASAEKLNHINCINNILNDVIEKAIQQVEELKELHNQCLELKKYFTNINTNCDLNGIFKSLCVPKWNASFYILDAIENNWLEIENFLQQSNKSQKIKNIKKEYIEDILRILKPFEHASKILENEKYPTIHLVYVYINGLKDSCSAEDTDDSDVMKRFKKNLADQLQCSVISNLSITHKIALFLFPPANKLTQFSEIEKNLIKAKITSYLKPYVQNKVNKEIKKEPSISAESNTMVSSYFKNFVTPPKGSGNCDEISNEIITYESLSIPYEDNFDILHWWNLRQTQFPLLYKLSCKILATPATCSSTKSIFSIARYLAENNAKIISQPKMFNQVIFLNFYRNKNLKIEEFIIGEEKEIENEAVELI